MSALRKVLVVDDDPVVGKSFNRVLSGKGYIVVTAEDGYEALQKLQSEHYDMVFTDLRMPGMDGVEVAEKVKARQPWTPVVIVTGYGSGKSEERARAAGVSEFLHKPLSPEMIEASAAKALEPAPPAVVTAAPAAAVPAAPVRKHGTLVNMLLFLSAPFIGLLYAVLLPFVGLGMLAWIGGKAAMESPKVREGFAFAKFMTKLAFAPFIGLGYVIAYPFVGLALLAWTGARALTGAHAAK
ncbi:response regulator [Ramlibacter sp. RBP-2]|uniref:Response regulator n=1 Tax=Ramlibacter lithotrophicus TaxID=2606681 RepID=A0A7X6I786_9BURK|nr:response regulator [Ramlibacter lithotrophicus]NKE67241.1 response regulator [Ramlibacter lithotrophicus]